MFVRRLMVLFLILALGAAALALRLAHLQVAQGQKWRDQARLFSNRSYTVETSRGPILDRNGKVVAQDMPCWDLALDYRAMNLDDRWIEKTAIARLKAAGVSSRQERIRLLPEAKLDVEQDIEGIRDAIAQKCRLSRDEVSKRYDDIRARMMALRQNLWISRINQRKASTQPGGDDDADAALDLLDERIAHPIVQGVPDEIAFWFDKHLNEFPGLVVQRSTQRRYPYGSVAAHVIGVMRKVDDVTYRANRFDRNDDDDTPMNLKGYLPGDRMGSSGVEKMAENQLRGSRGIKSEDLDGQENPQKHHDPVPGAPVRLTLDMELQRRLQAAIEDPARRLTLGQDGAPHPVAVVVMDARDNSVLLMLSTPTYDLNDFGERYRDLSRDTLNLPLANRAVQIGYPPGSTVKPLVSLAALTDKVVAPDEAIVCNGYLFPNQPHAFRCDVYKEYGITHGPITLPHAIEQSCNIFFYTLGRRIGYDRIIEWYKAWGLGAPTGIGLQEEFSGRLPKPAAALEGRAAEATLSDSIFLGIGQGPILVTPLQMANAYCGMLRGGDMRTPRLLMDSTISEPRKLPLPAGAIEPVLSGLNLVANGDRGTARKTLRMAIGVAGKTGSATDRRAIEQDGKKTVLTGDDAWFVGYVPAAEPKYVIAAVMEFGGHGGIAAAPLVRETVLSLQRLGYLPPVDVKD